MYGLGAQCLLLMGRAERTYGNEFFDMSVPDACGVSLKRDVEGRGRTAYI